LQTSDLWMITWNMKWKEFTRVETSRRKEGIFN
jgi:hypothetical protein